MTTTQDLILDALKETREEVASLRRAVKELDAALTERARKGRVAWISAGAAIVVALITTLGMAWRTVVTGECRDQAGMVAEQRSARALDDCERTARREGQDAARDELARRGFDTIVGR